MSIYRRYVLNEAWDEDTNSHAYKSSVTALRKKLLTPSEVKKSLKNGASPIDSSIEKWSRIRSIVTEAKYISTLGALENFIGASTCALCIDSAEKFKQQHGQLQDSSSKCTVCPLAQVQRCPDSSSVYSQIDQIVQNAKNAPQMYTEDPEVFNRLSEFISELMRLLKSL